MNGGITRGEGVKATIVESAEWSQVAGEAGGKNTVSASAVNQTPVQPLLFRILEQRRRILQV